MKNFLIGGRSENKTSSTLGRIDSKLDKKRLADSVGKSRTNRVVIKETFDVVDDNYGLRGFVGLLEGAHDSLTFAS